MSFRFILFSTAFVAASLGGGPVRAQPPLLPNTSTLIAETACNALNSLELPELSSIDARWTEAGPSLLPGIGDSEGELVELPDFCRVQGLIEPAIRFEVWLPSTSDWNGRFLGIGGGGFAGTISFTRLAPALQNGYAAASTDTGHMSGDYSWLGDDALLRDFAYRAVYEMTAKARVVVASFYQREADYRYFDGCSLGGRQGLMEAQRFPEDYDGIVAGAPVNAFIDTRATQVWLTQATQPVPGRSLLGQAELELLNRAATEQCDTLDGLADGVLEDPRRCNFDPRRLQCGFAPAGQCLTPEQVQAASRVYAGPSSSGAAIVAAPPAGRSPFGEGFGAATTAPGESPPPVNLPGMAVGSETGWDFATDPELSTLTLEFFRNAVFMDPFWDWRGFDLAADHAYAAETVGWMLDATAADLSRFRDRGGKLILYHGWNDTNNSPEATIGYYEAVEATLAAMPNPQGLGTRDFARLFLVPGMGHCSGGIGTDEFDRLQAIEDWVERGIAPDRIEAGRSEDEQLIRTRPLCPYPQTARYRGNGNADRSGSFVCTN